MWARGVDCKKSCECGHSNYKARDIDFQRILSNAQGGVGSVLTATHAIHLQPGSGNAGAELLYRIPTLPRLDGNTVDTRAEQAAFAENALRYSASLAFLDGWIKGLKSSDPRRIKPCLFLTYSTSPVPA